VTTSGDLSPGAIPVPFACVASIEATGIFFRSTLGLKTAQPLSAKVIADAEAIDKETLRALRRRKFLRKNSLFTIARLKTSDVKLFIADSVAFGDTELLA
jgi:hypothetical protein